MGNQTLTGSKATLGKTKRKRKVGSKKAMAVGRTNRSGTPWQYHLIVIPISEAPYHVEYQTEEEMLGILPQMAEAGCCVFAFKGTIYEMYRGARRELLVKTESGEMVRPVHVEDKAFVPEQILDGDIC